MCIGGFLGIFRPTNYLCVGLQIARFLITLQSVIPSLSAGEPFYVGVARGE
jgi:hypothetical protein